MDDYNTKKHRQSNADTHTTTPLRTTTKTKSCTNNNSRTTITRRCLNCNDKGHATLATLLRLPKYGQPTQTLPSGMTFQLAAHYANDAMALATVPDAKGATSAAKILEHVPVNPAKATKANHAPEAFLGHGS